MWADHDPPAVRQTTQGPERGSGSAERAPVAWHGGVGATASAGGSSRFCRVDPRGFALVAQLLGNRVRSGVYEDLHLVVDQCGQALGDQDVQRDPAGDEWLQVDNPVVHQGDRRLVIADVGDSAAQVDLLESVTGRGESPA